MKHKNIKVGMIIQNKKTMAFYKVMQCDFDNDFYYLDDFGLALIAFFSGVLDFG